ncbi:LGFP repeat-containing protein [Arthrobacter sp. HLT1-20]
MKKFRAGLIAVAVAGSLAFSGSVLAASAYTPQLTGAIGAKYESMGGPTSQLGLPLWDETTTYGGAQQNFQFGIMFWSPVGGAHPLWGAINAKWYPGHESGWPIRDEEPLGGGAIAQHFTNGTMYYTPQIGLHYIGAGIRQAWWNKGGQTGVAGYPVTDENYWYAGGAYQVFQGGTFYFTPRYGTKLIQGAIRAVYENNGGYFYMGSPVTDEYAANSTTRAQRFEDGVIYWSKGRTWVTRN